MSFVLLLPFESSFIFASAVVIKVSLLPSNILVRIKKGTWK